MRIPFTGSDSVTMALALDKALAKSVVRDAGVPTARSVVMKTGDEPIAGLVFPLLVKPNAEGSSKGVHPRSVVEDERALRETVHALIGKYGQDILVEEFLPGREFTVGLVGAQKAPRVLPPMEIVFVEPDSKHPIYAFGEELDWTQKIRYDRPAQMDAALAREVEEAALGVWRALGCRDVARVDLRQDARGRVCFIECNPLPGLTPGWSDLCLIAESAGLTHQALIGEIMKPAFARLEKMKAR
jgi:D-alanine-D-alanine ligase